MRICTTCVLPETFPGIRFDENGKCSYCKRHRGQDAQDQLKERYRNKFLTVLDDKRNNNPYDALMAYSGGKDSTYTLRLLNEEFGLNILAITFDHGFVSPIALQNIRKIIDRLNVDHIGIHPGGATLREVFVKSMRPDMYPIKALERASSICNSCMNIVKSFLLRTAIEMKVPLVAYGWSPGQAPVQSSVFKTNASMIKQMQQAMLRPVREMVGNRPSAFLLEECHYETELTSQGSRFPYLVHPLAFMNYDEDKILRSVRELGWVDPKDTDANSTNCLLNGFANQVHMEQHGFHPYAFEIAGLVREGYMTREEGLKKLSTPPDPKVIEFVKKKLGIKDCL